MKAAAPDDVEIPPRGKVKDPFCLIGNEVFDVFLPIMGADCFTIYALFVRRVFSNPKLRHNVRELATATGVGVTTVSRCLEILEHLRLVKVTRFGGSRDSECQLLDSWVVANRLGAIYESGTLSYSLPPEVNERLISEVEAIREKQQGKMPQSTPRNALRTCGNLPNSVSQRNASVSQAKRQRIARETQTGTHLIWEEVRTKETPIPTLTPNNCGNAQQDEDSPDEDEPGKPLRWAKVKFTGVMNDLGDHLFDTSRLPARHLANGAADWEEFGFNSLAVEAATWHDGTLELTFSASDPETARRGLKKYHQTFDASLRTWYRCEIKIALVKAERRRFCG